MVELTILSDNTVAEPLPRGLRGEWGFSVAFDDVLLDTGQSAALHNAALLDVDVATIDAIVVSHGHFDHATGLLEFLNVMDEPSVYAHPRAWSHRFLTREDEFDGAPMGIPHAKSTIEAKATVVEHRDAIEVADGVYALGEIPRPHPDAVVGKIETDDGAVVEDTIVDDQSLVVETGDGLALVLGCCHAGLRNTVEHAERVCGGDVRYIVGGTHLIAKAPDEVRAVADWLDGKVDLLGAAHCTGEHAKAILRNRLPDVYEHVGVGSRIRLGPDAGVERRIGGRNPESVSQR